jgi:hypothetical protein
MKNRLSFILAVFVLLQVSLIYPQTQQWATLFTGQFQASVDLASWITIDESGNSYVTGRSDYKYATVKYNSSGTKQWDAYYNIGASWANCIDINSDNYGVVYVTGYTTSNSVKQITTIAYNTSNGGYNWQQQAVTYNSEYGDCIGWMVKFDPLTDDIYVCGERTGNGTGLDYVVLRFDGSTGDLSDSWPDNGYGDGVRVYNGTGNGYDKALSLAISAGDVYITGVSYNDRGVYQNTTVAYEIDGDLKWVSSFAPGDITINERKNLIAADYSLGVYVTNTSNGKIVTVCYDPGDGSLEWYNDDLNGVSRSIGFFSRSIGNSWPHVNDVFVTGSINGHAGAIKYDENGDKDWDQQFSGSGQGYFLGLDAYENVYVCGYRQTTFLDVLIIKYDAAGNEICYSTYNGSGNSDDKSVSIAVDPEGLHYVTGLCYQTSTGLDYVTIKCLPCTNNGDNFTVHNPNGSEIPDKYSLAQNYPNPFNPATIIKYALPHNGLITLKVYDMLGREVEILVNDYKTAGNYEVLFDGSKLASGIYIYKLITSDFTDVKKMILVK